MTEATVQDLPPQVMQGWRALHVVRRNALVWRKLMITSLVGNLAEPLIYLVGLGYGVGALIGWCSSRLNSPP